VYAPPIVWTEMRPFVRAARLKASSLAEPATSDHLEAIALELRSLGSSDAEGFDQLRRRYVAAVKAELDPRPKRPRPRRGLLDRLPRIGPSRVP
jgi:hypothetical protein